MAQERMLFGGHITFDHRVQEWNIFKSRFTQFCMVNDITDDTDKAQVKRRSLILTCLVEETYRVVKDLVFPEELETLEFKSLISKLDSHFASKKCTFAERYKFYKAEQRPGEDLSEWASRVRHLAQYCGFKTELESALRDRFVLGLENIKEKEKLFAESIETLTFNRALEIAQSVRCARLALRESHSNGAVAEPSALPAEPAHSVFAVKQRGAVSAQRPDAAGRAAAAEISKVGKCCSVCGYKNHSTDQCRFINYACKKCNQKGHLKRMCRIKVKSSKFLTADDDDSIEGIYELFNIKCVNGEPMQQLVSVGSTMLKCEIDSGSAVSVLPAVVYNLNFRNKHNLKPSNAVLNCYNGSKISPLGCLPLPVTYKGRTENLKFYVVDTGQCNNKQPPLLGRDFISKFNLQLCSVPCNHIKSVDLVTYLRGKYAQLFTDELGTFNKHKVTLKIKPDAQLKFFKPRPVPLALKQKVENELHRLLELGILEKVEHSEVATPIVPVLRPDGNIRICGDYSVTLNKWLYTDSYPLPRIQDLFAKLHGGVQFSKLDLSRAYNQLLLDDTKKLTCINTHKGLFCFNRLVFGLSTAPSIFQRILEEVLVGIDGVCIFLDDILITAENQQRHLLRLEEVLSRLENSGFRVKENKCELFKDSVEYLGFIIDKNGLRKSNSKVEAILTSEPPKNVSELKSFLGMVNYYRSFIRGASSLMAPLHLLLKKGINWKWGEEQAQVFNKIKRELASERTLAHYNPELPTIVTADAGPRGLGAVLSHRYPDGTERVVAYASRSLSKAECNYSQIQKEAAAIVFSIKKFHHYVYGRVVPFTLRTDHKPLLSIFGSKKGVPEIAANRLQRYALFLSAYNFNLEYVKSEQNVADYLSRSVADYIKCNNEALENDDRSMFVNHITDSILKPITLQEIKRETECDETLRKIIGFVNPARMWRGHSDPVNF